jgi:hypothetical protein
MVSMKTKTIFVLLTVVLTTGISHPSSSARQTDKISSVRDERKSGPVRIYYGKDKDSLPESFDLTGTVVQQTLAPECGDVMFGSTLKIRPSQKITGYSPEFVYVVVLCMSEISRDFIGKTVNMHVKKSYAGEHPCECELIQNRIDSQGIPFYCAGGLTFLPK